MDYGTDAIITGMAVDNLCQRELAKLRQVKRPIPQPTPVEPSNAAVARQLETKALPAARRDAAIIQRAAAENELKRRADEGAWARARLEDRPEIA